MRNNLRTFSSVGHVVFLVVCVITNCAVAASLRPLPNDDSEMVELGKLLSALPGQQESVPIEGGEARPIFRDDKLQEVEKQLEAYYSDLNDCLEAVQKLNIIENYFYYVKGDHNNLLQSQITLCRLVLLLQSKTLDGKPGRSPTTAIEENMGTVNKRKFDKIAQGPLDLKRAYNRYSFQYPVHTNPKRSAFTEGFVPLS